jgi:hypothetical protein
VRGQAGSRDSAAALEGNSRESKAPDDANANAFVQPPLAGPAAATGDPPLSAFVVRKDGKERGCSFIDLLPSPLLPLQSCREEEETSEIVREIKKNWSSSRPC